MCSLRSVTASGIRLRCKCISSPNPGKKKVSQQEVFQPKMAWASKTVTKASTTAAPTKMKHCNKIIQKPSTVKSRKRPDDNLKTAAPVSRPHGDKMMTNSCYTCQLWTSLVPTESSADQSEQLSRLGTSRNSLVAVRVTKVSQDEPEVQVGQLHQLQAWLRPCLQASEAGRGTTEVSCLQGNGASYEGSWDSALLCTKDIQVGKEQAENIVSALQKEVEKKLREVALLQHSFEKLKVEFAAYREESKQEAALRRGELAEKEAQVTELKEVIYELEDEVEQHRAVKLYDNLTITQLENSVKKLQNEKRDLDREMKALRHKFKAEAAEWHQLQADLQTAVVVASSMASQAKEEMEELRQQLQETKQRNDKLNKELEEERTHNAFENKPTVRGEKVYSMSPAVGKLPDLHAGMRPKWCCSTSCSPYVKSLIRSFEGISQDPGQSRSSSTYTASNGEPFGFSPLKTLPAATVYPVQLRRPPKTTRLSAADPAPVAPATSTPTEKIPNEFVPSSSNENVKIDVHPLSPGALGSVLPPSTSASSTTVYVMPASQGVSCVEQTDPLSTPKHRNGELRWKTLLKWCQMKTQGYQNIHIKNFSSSWHDGLAFCAILHTYLPKHIPFWQLNCQDKRRNLTLAFQVAASAGIECTLDVDEMMWTERPDWQSVMTYIISIYKYFET